ncbi:hypothetical protein NITLEN_90135 [Nitrospira lenta]|uniref:Uncharacterized protein n=1 Tax=Nitrospira lenta TaxID=1436998 RepID=A0A330LI38_9BACT|nr:hypothetical protein NITLEN_90135 [Nitrospira lenta]
MVPIFASAITRLSFRTSYEAQRLYLEQAVRLAGPG